MGVKLGEEVGYTIRFEDVTKPVRISLQLSFICILCCHAYYYSHIHTRVCI